jgi:hypothetical protein
MVVGANPIVRDSSVFSPRDCYLCPARSGDVEKSASSPHGIWSKDMRKTFGLTALTAVSLLCAAAGTAAGSEAAPADETACANWDLSGQWTFFQSNEASPVFQLELTDTGLQGTGGFGYLVDSEPCPFFAACGKDPVYVSSSVDGTVTGNELELTSYWSDGSIGVYSGKVNAQGRIEGTTFDRQHPQTMASWYSDHTAKCLDGTSGSGGAVGTTSSALKTAPAEKPVRVARRGPVVPPANSMKITAIPVCDAAKNAHERNSPAALTLDGICRSRQASIEPGNVTAAAGRRAPPESRQWRRKRPGSAE